MAASPFVAAKSFAIVLFFAPAALFAQPVPSLDTIVGSLQRSIDGIESFRVSYSVRTVYDGVRDGPSANRPSSEVFAFDKSGKFFRHRRRWSENQDGQGEWTEERHVFDGERTGSQTVVTTPPRSPVIEPGTIMPDLQDGLVLQANVYMEGIGSPHYDGQYLDIWRRQRTENPPVKFSLPDALNNGEYRVVANYERIGDHNCVALEYPGRDKLWLDVDRGYALVQREWNWNGTTALMVRYRNSDFQQEMETLWLPRRVVKESFARPTGEAQAAAQRTRIDTCIADRIEVNSVDAALFSISFPPDTAVHDASRLPKSDKGHPVVEYQVGATPEETQQRLDGALANAKGRNSSTSTLLIVLNIVVLIALVALIIRRYVVG